MIIAISALRGLDIHQIDVKTDFLNRDLDEEIFKEGFINLGRKKKICRLVKSLYRLKQTLKQWHGKLDSIMLSNGL